MTARNRCRHTVGTEQGGFCVWHLQRRGCLYPKKYGFRGYFAQNGYKYNSNQNVMEFMQEDCDYNISEIRSVLASMGFKQNDIGKSLSVLSGGEIIKLLLAKMLMGRYNILLMDEPSNFLDIPSLEALEILMKEYAGTIVFITHDKRLLENVADVVYEIRDKKINLKH